MKTNEGTSPENLSSHSPKSKKSQHTEKSSTLSKAQIKAQQKQAEKIRKSVYFFKKGIC